MPNLNNAISDRRRQTRSSIYHYLYHSPTPRSKQDIARDLNLSLPTVYQNITELLDAGLIEYAGSTPSAGGRPAMQLRITPGARCAIGISVTGHQIPGDIMNGSDGGFLSYNTGYNYFTSLQTVLYYTYTTDGDDGGSNFTKTKQYPYFNIGEYVQNRESKPDSENASGGHLIVAVEQSHVTIQGPGRIDGNGLAFCAYPDGRERLYQRDYEWRPGAMLHLVECDNLRIRDVELVNSTYWNCFLHGCENVFVRGVRVLTPRARLDASSACRAVWTPPSRCWPPSRR